MAHRRHGPQWMPLCLDSSAYFFMFLTQKYFRTIVCNGRASALIHSEVCFLVGYIPLFALAHAARVLVVLSLLTFVSIQTLADGVYTARTEHSILICVTVLTFALSVGSVLMPKIRGKRGQDPLCLP